MKKQRLAFIAAIFFAQWIVAIGSVNAQALSGIYTINSSGSGATNFTSFDAAITALNTNGVSGNVTFDVLAGQTFTRNASSPVLTARGTASASITFQKSGTGANPVLSRSDAGSFATTVHGGQGDAVLVIQGADYVTFNGIDITSGHANIEYGVLFRKASGADGCQYSNFRNSSITMSGTSATVIGMYVSNLEASSAVGSSVGVTVTATSGRNEGIELTGNSIQNVQIGILNLGFNHTTSPYDFQDQQIKIGGSAGNGNTIGKFRFVGVWAGYSDNILITHNTIDYLAFGGSMATADEYGVWLNNGTECSAIVSNNTISVGMSTNTAIMGIRNVTYKKNITLENNSISLTTTGGTTGRQEFISIAATGSSAVLNVNNNQFGSSVLGVGNAFLMSFMVGAEANVKNNQVVGAITKSNTAAGTFVGFAAGNTVGGVNPVVTLSGNTIKSVTGTGSSSVSGMVLDLSGACTYKVYDNIVADLTSDGNVTGIQIKGVVDAYRNKIYNLKTNATTGAYFVRGLLYNTGTTVNVYNNFIGNLLAPAMSGTDVIRAVDVSNSSVIGTLYLYHNTIYLNASSTGTDFGTSGVYLTSSNSTTVGVLDMRNNIVVNKSTAAGTGRAMAFRRSGTLMSNYHNSSNRNLFFASTLHSDGTNHYTTLSSMKTAISPREASSYSEDVNFLSTTDGAANFLRVDPANAGVVREGGAYLSAYASDYDLEPRNPNAPDLGADQFATFNLPVILSSFTAVKKDAYHEVNWVTSSEINNAGFHVERSGNGVDFLTIGFVPSHAWQGNSTQNRTYSFQDTHPLAGLSYYRLRQEDRDGKQQLSKVVRVRNSVSSWSMDVFPNPAKDMLNVQLHSLKASLVNAQLINMNGSVLRQKSIQTIVGETRYSWNISDVTPGTYLLVLTHSDGSLADMMRCIIAR